VTPTPNMNPVDELLAAESDRDKRARELGTALTALLGDVETYREAWKQALATGFARTDLLRVGFIDPAKLLIEFNYSPGHPPPPRARLRRGPCARGTSSNRPTH